MPWNPVGKFEWQISWASLTGVPAFASRWPTWSEVTGKPTTFAPAAHAHAAADITSGTFSTSRIPDLPAAKVTSGVLSSARLGSGTASASTWLRGDGTWAAIPAGNAGTVTSVAAGNGMVFSTITGSGSVALGAPSTITPATTNAVTGSSHTHSMEHTHVASGSADLPTTYPANAVSLTRYNSASGTGWPAFGLSLNLYSGPSRHGQFYFETAKNELHFRNGTDTAWSELRKVWHDGNYDAANSLVLRSSSIGAGQDLNTYTSTGLFHQSTNAYTSLELNYPVLAAGLLTVVATSVMVYQTYERYNTGQTFRRSSYNGTWSAWMELASTDIANGKADSSVQIVAGNGLSGGGSLAASRTLSLGTPSSIDASTTNSATTSSHTHAIANITETSGRTVLSRKEGRGGGGTIWLYADDDGVGGVGIATGNSSLKVRWDVNGVQVAGAVPWGRLTDHTSLVAGNGLSGGGSLSENRTLTLGTPSNITLSSTNSVTTASHTHNFAPGGTASQYINGTGALAAFPSIPTSADFVATSGNQTGLSGDKTWTGVHTFIDINVRNVYGAGTATFGDGIRLASSGSFNYFQSGATMSAGSWQNIRFAPYASAAYNLEIRSTGIHVTGTVTADGDIYAGGMVRAQNGRFQSNNGTADLVSAASGAGCRILPNGFSTTGMSVFTGDGALTVPQDISAGRNVVASQDITAGRYLTTTGGRVYGGAGTILDLISINQPVALRPNGYSNTGAAFVNTDGTLVAAAEISDNIGAVRAVLPQLVNSSGGINLRGYNGRIIYSSTTTNLTWTLSGAQTGDTVTFLHDGTSGTKTLTPGSGITLVRGAVTGNVVLSAGQSVTVTALTATKYRVFG